MDVFVFVIELGDARRLDVFVLHEHDTHHVLLYAETRREPRTQLGFYGRHILPTNSFPFGPRRSLHRQTRLRQRTHHLTA